MLEALSLEVSAAEVRDMIREGDTDHSGTIELQEFLTLMAR